MKLLMTIVNIEPNIDLMDAEMMQRIQVQLFSILLFIPSMGKRMVVLVVGEESVPERCLEPARNP
jgi:hypothetical protein